MQDDDDKDDGDDKVGYGRPPKHSRFKPGQSGNPRGRPKKSKDLNRLIQAELNKVIVVTENGRTRHITKLEGFVTQLVNRAMKGEPKLIQFILAHLEKNKEVEPFVPTEADDAAVLATLLGDDDKEDDDGDR